MDIEIISFHDDIVWTSNPGSRGSHFSYVDKDATTMKPTCNNPSTSNDPTAEIYDPTRSIPILYLRDVAYYHGLKYQGPDECPCFSDLDVRWIRVI